MTADEDKGICRNYHFQDKPSGHREQFCDKFQCGNVPFRLLDN